MSDAKYIRDERSKGLTNTNREQKARMEEARRKARQAKQLESRVEALETEVKELKELIYGSKAKPNH